jgi:hypothetical protein
MSTVGDDKKVKTLSERSSFRAWRLFSQPAFSEAVSFPIFWSSVFWPEPI